MASADETFPPGSPEDVVAYYQDHPIEWARREAELTLSPTQRELFQAVKDGHDQILYLSGNGVGKTAGVTALAAWFFHCFYNSFTLLTSGNYDILTDMSFPFLKSMRRTLTAKGWKSEKREQSPRLQRPDFDQWLLRYISPRYPENLQGRHGRRSMVVIEEADKPDISRKHIDSAGTTATDARDLMVVVANPPEDRGNVVYDLMEDPNWFTIQFSSFDSPNVQLELGADDPGLERIPGLVTLDRIKRDWERYNRRPWPGAEAAAQSHPDLAGPGEWANLDPRWYRVRLGKMPPGGSGTLRPFYETDVEAAVDRWEPWMASEQQALPVQELNRLPGDADPADARELVEDMEPHVIGGRGMDIARGGGDRTVIVDRRVDGVLNVQVETQPGDHTLNDRYVDAAMEVGKLAGWFHIDALGEGSGTADRARKKYPGVRRFQASTDAEEDTEYYDARTEAMVHLGDMLRDGELVVPPNGSLEQELRQASRVLKLEERHLRAATVLNLKGKDELKKPNWLGRSPDVLDAAALACYEPRERQHYTEPNVGGIAG